MADIVAAGDLAHRLAVDVAPADRQAAASRSRGRYGARSRRSRTAKVRQSPGQHSSGRPIDDRDQVQKSLPHRYVGYVSGPHLVRPVDRHAAQKVRVDLVPGMPLAGVPLRPDRPQPELPHHPPDAPAANRNPLSQQSHLKPAAAVDGMASENPVEPFAGSGALYAYSARPGRDTAKPENRDYGRSPPRG
jgi:hypothetical protein